MNDMVLVMGLITIFAVIVYFWTVIGDKRMDKEEKKRKASHE